MFVCYVYKAVSAYALKYVLNVFVCLRKGKVRIVSIWNVGSISTLILNLGARRMEASDLHPFNTKDIRAYGTY